MSKPGLRVYAKSTALPKVLGGLGVAIISTSTGLLTDSRPPSEEWAGKSSPTSGRGGNRCLESAGFRSPCPRAWTSTIDGQQVTVKGPKGELRHTVAEPITVERGDDGTLLVHRPDDEREPRRCTACPAR